MKKAAVGVDIGGTSVKLGLVNAEGRVLARDGFLSGYAARRAALLGTLAERTKRLLALARRRGLEPVGVGIGAPGPVDVERGTVYFFPNIPGWKNTPLRKILQARLGCRVFLDNDANAMALGEYRFGAGRGTANLIALTLGAGIGGGIVLDGKLFHGPRYSAAEIGHLVINEAGPACGCGSRGCVETYVGHRYFIREVKRRLRTSSGLLKSWVLKEKRELTPELVAQAARRGDRLSREMWRQTGAHLGTALAGLVNILNPERIIIGGGMAQAGTLLLGPVRAVIRKKSFPIAARSVKVMPAQLGVDAGVIGAAALAFAGSK